MISIGICSRYVHQLAVYPEDNYMGSVVSMDALTNVTRLCNSIEVENEKIIFQLTFFRNVSRKVTAEMYEKPGKCTYKEKCDEKEMRLYKVEDCLRSFYYEVYSGATNCTKLYNFTSDDMEVRKKAFTSGKECLLSFNNQSCWKESTEYFKNSYDKLVDYLTIDNDGPDQCNSLNDELNSYQCVGYQYEVSYYSSVLKMAKLSQKPYEKNETGSMIDETRKCYRKSCKYTTEDYQKLDKLYEDVVNYISDYPVAPKSLSEFDRCFDHILQYINDDYYDCVRRIPQKSGNIYDSAPTVKLTVFLRDKECMKQVMTHACWLDLQTFEDGWEATRNQMKTLWKEMIDE